MLLFTSFLVCGVHTVVAFSPLFDGFSDINVCTVLVTKIVKEVFKKFKA